MITPHDGSSLRTSKRSEPKTDLHAPPYLAELDTPASTLSLAILLSDFTPAASPTDALAEAFSKLNMRSPSMPTLFTGSSPTYSPGDLHSKLQAETPHRSKTNTMNSVVRAFSASKTLHHVLGMRDPEPFVTPPEMPHDLRERFEVGLQEYEQLYAAGVCVPNGAEDCQASVPPQQGKTSLPDILEEKESPIRTTPVRPTASGTGRSSKISVPKWTFGKQAVAVAQRYAFLDSDSDAANDTASEHTDYELDVEDYKLWEYGSSTTLATSDYSRPGSSASGNELSSIRAPSFAQRTSSLLPYDHVYSSNNNDSTTRHPISKILEPRPTSTHPTAPANRNDPDKQVYSSAYNNPLTLRRTESLPVLFPSPGVGKQSWDFAQTENDFVSSSVGVESPRNPFGKSAPTFNEYYEHSSLPQITVQAPSPKKAQTSRKRAPSSSANDDDDQHLSQRARRTDNSGLPVLSSDAEATREFKFLGNTNALLTILLTWSHTMWALHHQLPDPKLFAAHAAFPYQITPPLKKELVSVSFYDTNCEPHKEVRFLGPGDVAEMSYHEVDVFSHPDGQHADQNASQSSFPVRVIKQTLDMCDNEAAKHVRYTSMVQRAKTGEGRWCYVLIKGQRIVDGDTPPHLMLAWHSSAVTATSDCLHTIYPDNATAKPTAPSQPKLKRLSSLQNFGNALRNPTKFNFHQTLRSASSSSELPPVDTSVEVEQRGGVTLHRTVLKLEKAGSIPLIEGFRVDVAAFRGWLDACGRGSGKVIMWRERETA